MAVAYWFDDGGNFDDYCALVVGGETADGIPSAYRVSNAGALMSDRYLDVDYGPSAFSVFGGTPFNSAAGLDIANFIAAINRHIIPASIPNVSDFAVAPAPATAGVRFNTNRNIDQNEGGSYSSVDQWAASLATTGSFEVRFVAISGDTGALSGADSVWRQLSSAREVSITASGGSGTINSASVRADWRKTGSGVSYFSSQFLLTASQS